MNHLKPPARRLEAADLAQLGHLLPPTAHSMRRVLGDAATVVLINARPGVTLRIPTREAANPAGQARWEQLVALIGPKAAQAAAGHWGGSALLVPVCRTLLGEKRDRWLRQQYDRLTSARGGRHSANAAIHQLAIALAEAGQPYTEREVEKALSRADLASRPLPANSPQIDLFAEQGGRA